jgi:Flp pilus assembly protein TadG
LRTERTHSPASSRSGARARGDRGGALVEFAIIAPLVFMLLIGTFTGGVALSRKNSMTNAVREGARLGATLNHDAAWAGAVRDRVVELAGGDLTTAQVCVKLVQAPSTQIRASSCPAALAGLEPAITGVPAGDCTVLVWAQRTSEIEAVLFSRDLTLTSKSVSRYERDCP